MTIVRFPQKTKDEDVIFVCNCGCASFELCSNGAARCRGCQNIVDDQGAWRVRDGADRVHDGQVAYEDGGNDASFAERKAKRDADGSDWLIFGNAAGRITSWSRDRMETPEQEAWLREAVAVGLDAILSDKPR